MAQAQAAQLELGERAPVGAGREASHRIEVGAKRGPDVQPDAVHLQERDVADVMVDVLGHESVDPTHVLEEAHEGSLGDWVVM